MRGRLVAIALEALLRCLGWLSFGTTQRLGRVVGDVAYLRNGTLRRVSRTNLAACFPELSEAAREDFVRESLRHTGRYAAELGIAWRRADRRWKSLIAAVDGVAAIDDAQRLGRGVLILVPHFGNWEVLNLFLGARYGLTALYEPARIRGLDSIVRDGRMRTGSRLVPTTSIRVLYAALRAGGVAAVLPDQVPPVAAGAYAPFFGRPALTMTLVHRLTERLAPRLIMGHARRLPDAAGFSLGFEVLSDLENLSDREVALTKMNIAIERLVRTDPAQYQWEYKRFKRPRSLAEKLY